MNKLPKFIQIVVQSRDDRIIALGEDGTVWEWNNWRPTESTAEYKRCWNKLTRTYEEAWPEPTSPKLKLEECFILPPTPEEEAKTEVERMLE